MFALLNLVLNALLGKIELLDVVLFALAYFLSPLGVPPIEFPQELVLCLLELILGLLEALIHRLYTLVCLVECLVECLLLGHQFHAVGLDARQFVFHLSETGRNVKMMILRFGCTYCCLTSYTMRWYYFFCFTLVSSWFRSCCTRWCRNSNSWIFC